ncbi:MAG: T9SS type A sorting domain-containing protein [bacterium]
MISIESASCSIEDKIYVVWSDNRTGNREIFLRYSEDAGETWSNEEQLTYTESESIQPALACDIKYVYFVWTEMTENSSEIYLKKWDGISWSQEIKLSNNFSRKPKIACTLLFPESYLYIVWEEYIPDNKRTVAYVTRSKDNGNTFTDPEPVTNGSWNTKEPALYCGARDAYVVWTDNREGDWQIYAKRWGEVQTSNEIKLSTTANCNAPSIFGIEPVLYTAWQCKITERSYSDIFVSRSTNFGSEWSEPIKITKGKAESILPKFTILDQEPWLFWQSGENGIWQIWFLNSQYWKQKAIDDMIQPLTDISKPAILPDVISTKGQIHLFWTQIESNEQSVIRYIRRDTLPPSQPGTPYHFDISANAGFDDDKQITFIWDPPQSKEKVKYKVYVSINNGDFNPIGETEETNYNIEGNEGKTYQVYVSAIDMVGNMSIPSGVSKKVFCDPNPPEIIIHSPFSDSVIRGEVPVIVSVTDITLLEWKIEYGSTITPAKWNYLAGPFYNEVQRQHIITWDTSDLDGIYTIRVMATDKAGAVSRVMNVVNIDSRPPTAVTSGKVKLLTPKDSVWTYGSPVWSPDGDKIAFYSNEGGTIDIWIISSDGKASYRLTHGNNIEINPAWSPDGSMIAYQSLSVDNDKENYDIWIIKKDGSDAKQITFIGSNMNPSWSPDGSALAFESDYNGYANIMLITNMRDVINGAEPKLFKLTSGKWDDKKPRWSPDGSRIVFQTNRMGNWDIFEIGADGSGLKPFIATLADEVEPDWSPDRRWIIYSTNEPGYCEIQALDWPERIRKVKLSPAYQDAHTPKWSPFMDSFIYESGNSLFIAELTSPTNDLEAMISSPRTGEIITGKVEIKGIARGSNFKSYSLQYLDPNTGNYKMIGGESTSQLSEIGFLGAWYTDELEGEYLLKLVVTGKDGKYIESRVQVLISNRIPYIILEEPQNGIVTNRNIIKVGGYTDRGAIVTINDESVYLNDDGSFSQDFALVEGQNEIIIKARNSYFTHREFIVKRNIIFDSKSPDIEIEAPYDFQLVYAPYITVKGIVDEKAEVYIQSVRVWTDSNGNFQQAIELKEGVNNVIIEAVDEIGHYSKMARRVIYKKDTESRSDVYAPAIINVFPGNYSIITKKTFDITAKIIDNVGIDPFSLIFYFDGNEIENDKYNLNVSYLEERIIDKDQFPSIEFSYNPVFPLSEGQHSFSIQVSDTSGNTTISNFVFNLDIDPAEAIVSAFLSEQQDKMKVIITSNKTLENIKYISVLTREQKGYSISSINKRDNYYEAILNIAPSQNTFFIDFLANTHLGKDVSAKGFLSYATIRAGEILILGIDNGPSFYSKPVTNFSGKLTAVLRSHDGLDSQTIDMYKNNAYRRKLQPVGLTYVLSTSMEIKEGAFRGILKLPIEPGISAVSKNLIMFMWDSQQNYWVPLEKLESSELFISSVIDKPGIYTLFADTEPPIISDVLPKDGNQVPLEKFFITAKITDVGSGISKINLFIDGKASDFDYDKSNGILTYFPSELSWGFHGMKIVVSDRAGNISEFSTSFITKEIFKFISSYAYPNPAKDFVNIAFNLTRAADVKLRIYNILGEQIYNSVKESSAQGKFEWKCLNNAGKEVSSGIYIYIIEAKLFNTKIYKSGKIALIR